MPETRLADSTVKTNRINYLKRTLYTYRQSSFYRHSGCDDCGVCCAVLQHVEVLLVDPRAHGCIQGDAGRQLRDGPRADPARVVGVRANEVALNF